MLVVFGASGDLTSRKLMPAIARLANQRQLPGSFGLVGVARTEISDEDFRKHCMEAVPDAGPEWESLVRTFRYVAGEYADDATFEKLDKVLNEIDNERGTSGNRVYYLATIPGVFGEVATQLGKFGLAKRSRPGPFTRIVIEKPYGRDLLSSQELDEDDPFGVQRVADVSHRPLPR